MKVLNLLTSGGLGGIEILNYDFGRYSNTKQAFAFLFGTGTTYTRMKNAGYEVFDLSSYKPKICKERFRKLSTIAKNYDLVVVHHGDPYLKLYFNYLIRWKHQKGIAFIHSCWDDSLFFPNSKIKHYLGKIIFQRTLCLADRVVFVSEAGKKSYERNFNLKNNSVVIYNGVGEDKIKDGFDNSIAKGGVLKILYVGRVEVIKGIDILIESIGQIRNEYKVELTIVGGGTQKESLIELAENLGISDVISFVGPQSDVKPFYRMADIFVYPSRCQEVFGISIVEAMAYGLICVANNVGGIPEVISDGENGYLNNKNDVDGLTEKLCNSIDMILNGKYAYMSSKAKETARKFSIVNTCMKLDAIYNELSMPIN